MALSKYQEVAKRILGFKEGDFTLDMDDFEGLCGTSYCLAGWLAHQDGYPEEYMTEEGFDYRTYSTELIGSGYFDGKWEFLFSPYWPSSLSEAHKRAQYALDTDSIPDDEELISFIGVTE